MTFTIREFIAMDIDIDVYNDVYDEEGIAYCGPTFLTPKGEEDWGDVLEYSIEICDDTAIILIDRYNDYEHRALRASAFFWAIAGYCSSDKFDSWFYYGI